MLEVAALIEGIPYISAVPVEPGLTNAVHFQNGKRFDYCKKKAFSKVEIYLDEI